MVCRLVVCLSVTLMSPAKTAELIEMLFALRTWVVPENDVFDGGPDPHGKGQFLGKGTPIARYLPWAVQKWLNRSICCLGGRLGWAKGSTSSIVFARWRQRALMGGHIGATWWIQLLQQCGLMSTYFDHLLCLWRMCWQVGGNEEYRIVEAIESKRITKPVIAWCIGTCARMFTSEVCTIN